MRLGYVAAQGNSVQASNNRHMQDEIQGKSFKD
jgi:hypothetical protein